MWKDREAVIRAERAPLIDRDTRIATIGSCFAAELAAGLERFGLKGGMHPAGLFYNTRSILQELDRICGGWAKRLDEPMWRTRAGFIHPFKNQQAEFGAEQELRSFSDDLDRRADDLLRQADIIVVTLGLIEAWRNPKTGNVFRQIPHSEAFPKVSAEFFRLSIAEMQQDLEAIYELVTGKLGSKLIVTVSPIPLHATMTNLDVRIANTESKARIRAAVSEFVEAHPDVRYFHSYEMVATAENASDFMLEDGRHVHRHAVDFILAEFLRLFAADGIAVPQVDRSFLTQPTKTAIRPAGHHSLRQRAIRAVKRNAKILLHRFTEARR